ncbi:MAG: hypothetical protein WCJ37_20570 [Syntrophus sp. (in: bacteria)]
MKKCKYGFDHATGDGQKRLMALSMGLDPETYIGKRIDTKKAGDYGSDPLGNGMFRMVPSGDVAEFAERNQRMRGDGKCTR